MGFVDLHVHSTYSDGTYTPSELVDYAIKKGLTAIALTDHDTVDGLDELIAYAKEKPIEVISGIEYSTEYNGRDVHIVGLFIDYKAPIFLEYLARFQQSRTDRNYKLCANLQSAGIDITYEALMKAFPNSVITRAHYAAFLLDKGYVKSRNEAFDRYLGDRTPYFVHREKITPEEVIDVTLKAGGIPVLAHPTLYQLGWDQLNVLLDRLKEAGLMGIESYYSTYSHSDQSKMKSLEKKYNLLASGGSDFHGDNKQGLDLGVGYGKLYIPQEVLSKMKKALTTKILFTDLDDTLLTKEKTVSEKTRKKIIELLARGNHFVLSSGRSINSVLTVLEKINIKDSDIRHAYDKLNSNLPEFNRENDTVGGIYVAAYNGAVLYDCTDNKACMIQECGVPIATAQAIFDMALERGIHIQTYSDTHIISSADDKELAYYTRTIEMDCLIETKLDKILSREPFKLIAIDLDNQERLRQLRTAIESSKIGKEVTCVFSNPRYLDIYHKKAGKGNALIALCNVLNVHVKNSIAVGDEENDRSMIEAAAIGVCMVNGNPTVKECANYITENDNNKDGVAEVIDRFILKN